MTCMWYLQRLHRSHFVMIG